MIRWDLLIRSDDVYLTWRASSTDGKDNNKQGVLMLCSSIIKMIGKFAMWENNIIQIKRHWTPFVMAKTSILILVYSKHLHKKQICDNLDSISHRSCKGIMQRKTPIKNDNDILHNSLMMLIVSCTRKRRWPCDLEKGHDLHVF